MLVRAKKEQDVVTVNVYKCGLFCSELWHVKSSRAPGGQKTAEIYIEIGRTCLLRDPLPAFNQGAPLPYSVYINAEQVPGLRPGAQ